MTNGAGKDEKKYLVTKFLIDGLHSTEVVVIVDSAKRNRWIYTLLDEKVRPTNQLFLDYSNPF